ncbi:MAG: RDD family protein [Bacilli bacterium]|nr:RDD family protein [Bacilli bacterium]
MDANVRTERQPINGFKYVEKAGLFARFVAFIVDLAIMAFVMMGILIFAQNVVMANTPIVKNSRANYIAYNVDSGLFHLDEDGKTLKPNEFNTYEGYQNLFINYYTNFLKSEKIPEKYRVNYDIYWYNVHVLGQPDTKGTYASEDFKKTLPDLARIDGPTLFTYHLDDFGEPLVDEVAIPKCLNNDPSAPISDNDQATLIRFLYISDANNQGKQAHCYYYAVADLNNRGFVNDAYRTWSNAYYTYPLITCFAISMLIFFFAIPMFMKNGETLGKLFFHLGLVNKLGYTINKSQIVIRFFMMTLIVVAIVLIFGINIYTLGAITVLALGSYGFAVFGKDHKALHDFAAGTIVIDKRKSTIFKNVNEMEQFEKEVNAVKPIDYSKGDVSDTNILWQKDDKKVK